MPEATTSPALADSERHEGPARCRQPGGEPGHPLAPPGLAKRDFFLTNLCRVVLLAAGLAVTWQTYTTGPEFGRHPDEAGHLVTGTLVHDWIASGFSSPLPFAREYYARYPKVALGHWPPFFYCVQGAWYTAFGVSPQSTFLLVAVMGGGLLLLLFECLRRRLGLLAAFAATSLVVAGPVFHYCNSQLLADLLVAILALGATWVYARFLETGDARAALGFGALAALAMLTKQDAAALAAVPPLSLVLLRRWGLLKNWRFYLPLGVVVVLCGPVYALTNQFTRAALDGVHGPSLSAKLLFLAGGFTLAGWAGAVLTVLGAAVLALRRWRPQALGTLPVVMLAGAAALVLIHLRMPVSLDPRYRASLLAPVALLAGCAFHLLSRVVTRPAVRVGVTVAVVGLLALAQPAVPGRQVAGYRSLVGALPAARPGPEIVLACSDPMGDGALAAEFRFQHHSRTIYLLRADKMLASSTWMGRHYKCRYNTPAEVEDYLTRQPVHYLVLDDWGDSSGTHYDTLRRLVTENPGRFPLLGTFTIRRSQSGSTREREARVYEVAATKDANPESIDLNLPGLPGGPNIRVPCEARGHP